MFSSLSDSLSNLYQNATFSISLSPQAILASYLSASLAEFLQVDSHSIETSLLAENAHVKLHHVQLKPRTVKNYSYGQDASVIALTGTIQLIEFSWEWDTQTYISNARLKIVGVDLHLGQANNYGDTAHTAEGDPSPTNTNPSLTTSGQETDSDTTDWKARYMQQIMDHLSVTISDLKITVGLENNKSLIVVGSVIDLVTDQNQGNALSIILQRTSLQSLSAYFVQPDGEKMQLLDAFGYSATVHRVSGRRFVDGIMNGLVIHGHAAQESIQWYLGKVQIKGLLQLVQLLRVVEPDADMSLPEYTSNDSGNSSVFQLSFPVVNVRMEENIKLQFDDCSIQYRTNGAECILQLGRASAMVKEESIAVLNNLTIDAVNCCLVVGPSKEESDLVNVNLSLSASSVDTYRIAFQTYNEIMQRESCSETVPMNVDCDTLMNQKWSLDIQGTSRFEISNDLGWIQCSIDSLSVLTRFGHTIPFDANWKYAHLSSSHGIEMDVLVMNLSENIVRFDESTDISAPSMDAVTQLQEFLRDAVSILPENGSQTSGLPCDVILSKISVNIAEPNGDMHCVCENVKVEGIPQALHVGHAQVRSLLPNGSDSHHFSCHDLRITFEPFGSGPVPVVKVKVINMSDMQYLSSVRVPSLYAEATLDPKDRNSFSDVKIIAREAVLTADFKSENWSRQIESEVEVHTILLPYINVSKMNLALNFIGHGITLDNAVIGLPEFNGNASSRSDTLASHYVRLVKKRLPFLLVKTNVAGVNVGDSISSAVATLSVKSSLVGTLVGVVGRDGVGAAISAGKASRGASESERYHFGDFSKGLAASARSASMSGSQMRGDDTYKIGDFSSGVAAASSNYTSENRVRLSSAIGSGVGMVAGMALAGPVGLVAGSLLAGKAVGDAVERRFGDPKNKTIQQDSITDDTTPENRTVPSSPDVFSPQQHLISQPSILAPQPSASPAIHSEHHFQADPFCISSGVTTQPPERCESHADPFGNMIPTVLLKDGQESDDVKTAHASRTVDASTDSQQQAPTNYKFGNLTRGIIARGKAARGANKAEGYKFGDFTRGFLG